MHFCGLDVSLRQTAICIVDEDGKIVKEVKVGSDPDVLARFLGEAGYPLQRIGLEAGSTAAWLQAGLVQRGRPAVCIDARHAAALKTGFRNKNDQNNARGIAQMMRTNSFRPVWVKSMAFQRLGAMFTARNTIQDQLIRIENVIR
jgi:transposase